MLAALGVLVATSANLPGGPDPRRLADVPAGAHGRRRGAVVDGGELPGAPSTVVDLTGGEPVGAPRGRGGDGRGRRADPRRGSYGSLTRSRRAPNATGERLARMSRRLGSSPPPQPRVAPPARRAGGARQGPGGRDGSRDLGRRAERRSSAGASIRAARARAGTSSTATTTRLRLAQRRRAARGTAPRPSTSPSSSAASRRASRTTTASSPSNDDGTSRGADVTLHRRGGARGRDGAARFDRAVVGRERRRDGRPQRAVDRLVDRVRHLDEATASRTDTRSAGAGASAGRRLAAARAASARGSTYHFRVVAANDVGTVRGADRSFRTDPAPSVSTGRRRRRHDLLRARERDRRPAGPRHAAWFEYGTTRGARKPDGRDRPAS